MKLVLLTALAMVAFGANSVLNRAAVDMAGMDPMIFAVVRVASGAAMLLALVALRGKGLPRAGLLPPVWLALYMVGFSWAYRGLDAGVGALILFGGVQVTMFAGALLAREAIPPRRWVGMSLAFAGLVWLSWPAQGSAVAVADILAMCIGAVGWGLYSLAGRREADALGATAMNFALCLPLVGTLAVIAGWGASPASGLALAVVSGAVTSGLGYALWYRVLPRLSASAAGVIQLSAPVVAVFGGVVFLSETVTWPVVGAAVLILGGIAVAVLHRPARSESDPPR